MVIQDGSSFAIKDALREFFPGRFTKVRPAAVELHVTLDLLKEAVTRVALTPDTFSERTHLPSAEELRGALLLADRGYVSIVYLAELMKAGASFVIRALCDINAEVIGAYTAGGKPLKGLVGRRLKDAKRLAKREAADLDVRWLVNGEPVECRLLVTWNPTTREYQYLVRNLPRERYSVEKVAHAYRLRWQVGVSGEGHIIQSVKVRPRPRDSGLAAWGCNPPPAPVKQRKVSGSRHRLLPRADTAVPIRARCESG